MYPTLIPCSDVTESSTAAVGNDGVNACVPCPVPRVPLRASRFACTVSRFACAVPACRVPHPVSRAPCRLSRVACPVSLVARPMSRIRRPLYHAPCRVVYDTSLVLVRTPANDPRCFLFLLLVLAYAVDGRGYHRCTQMRGRCRCQSA